jgi:hypothetical protein
MSDADKLFLGIRKADTTPTHQTKPTSQPDTDVLNSINHFEHKVRALKDTSKPAFYATCYENGKGDQGLWSPIVEAVIA